jgi:NADH:ubiquinone oxidoreductase subunit C
MILIKVKRGSAMFFILDTWLDNKIPSIRIISKETGQSFLEFKGSEVQQLLDHCVIDAEDLYSRNNLLEKEVIYALFSYARQQIQARLTVGGDNDVF